MKTWHRVALILLVVGFLFANPVTRQIITFLLPLGSGVDDLIEVVVILVLIGVFASRGWLSWNKSESARRLKLAGNERKLQVALVVTIVGILLLVPLTRQSMTSLIFFGDPIDPTFWFVLAGAAVTTALGWILISKLT